MPMLAGLRHKFYLFTLRLMAPIMPGSTHVAFVGSGSAARLCQHLATLAPRKVLIVTDKPLRDLGIAEQATAALADAGVACAWFDGVLPDPTYEQVDAGLAILKAEGCDLVLAVGGGSAMDCAKVIAARESALRLPRSQTPM